MLEFKIVKKSKKSEARIGVLKTPRGELETPVFVPVATQAAVKTLTSEEVGETGSRLLIANTFHLHLKPGEKIVKNAGGLHKFMNWRGSLMTDSGGFQVFSLGFGRDFGVGKILKRSKSVNASESTKNIRIGQQPQNIKIVKNGVWFKSPMDGRKIFIGPKESMKIQEALGADIIFAFDECTPPLADYEYTKKSLKKTHEWAVQSLKFRSKKQAIFGIVQGGKFKDLRIESAKFIGALPFDGFGIGGEFGDDKKIMERMLKWTLKELPENKPRHLLGIGHPEDLERIIKSGVDSFDCIAPTHYARRGIAFVSAEQYGNRLDLSKHVFLKDKRPLDEKCDCFVCQNYRRNYIAHLIRAKEISGMKMLTFHNLYFFNSLVEEIKEKIKRGKI